jgi:hypothetical protein
MANQAAPYVALITERTSQPVPTTGSQYVVATDRYPLRKEQGAALGIIPAVKEGYFDALDAMRLTSKTLGQTNSVKVMVKRGQQAISLRNEKMELQRIGKATKDDIDTIEGCATVIEELTELLRPLINCDHGKYGWWYWGDLKDIPDAEVDAKLPVKRNKVATK